MLPFLTLVSSVIGTPSEACYQKEICARLDNYLKFSDSDLREPLKELEDTCPRPWFADSGIYYLNRVYEVDGEDAAKELLTALKRVWTR